MSQFNIPANMKTIEKQFEDVAHDIECPKDKLENVYKFTHELDFSGIINDSRV